MHRTLVPLLVLLLALPAAAAAKPNKKVCGDTATGYAHCNSRVVTDAKGNPAATATPRGYGPADLQAAYGFPSASNGTGKTFAQGDFNYDGTVDLTDFTILAAKFNQSLAAPGATAAVSRLAAPAPVADNSDILGASGATLVDDVLGAAQANPDSN